MTFTESTNTTGDSSTTHFHSKHWANDKLRFCIKLLKGQICNQTFERSLSDAITIQRELMHCGFVWQAERVQNWINLARKTKDFIKTDKASSSFTAGSADPDDSLTKKRDVSFVSSLSWGDVL